ncbi:MAG TPA: molybdopterin synthase sulfur carrier subunit [Gammaproteobacteria bacterium]|nr:molybdopterin synthase sulfur carrier subunit [Gammaproteobacteria bacterium]
MSTVTIRYFASIREQLGRANERIELSSPTSAGDIWQQAAGGLLPSNTLVAINQIYASPQTLVHPGDELAFFPPVTGG